MSSEAKSGMVLGLICVVMFAVISAGSKTNPVTSPTPGGNQTSPRINVPMPDV